MSRAKLALYNKNLKRKTCPFPCPHCNVSVLPGNFERHCGRKHRLDPKTLCVWCFGVKEWSSGEKNLHADHLKVCSRKFLASTTTTAAAADGGSSTTNRFALSRYRKELKRKRGPFPCPFCDDSIASDDLEEHCFDIHGLDPRRCCVWCKGEKNWSGGKKHLNADHLTECFRKFVALNKSSGPESVEERVVTENVVGGEATATTMVPVVVVMEGLNVRLLDDSRPMCEARQFFGKKDLSHILPPEAFGQFLLLDHGNRVKCFRDRNLNAAASYVRMYVEIRDSTDWIHVIVKAATFASFVEAVRKDAGRTRILSFSCWCDGGTMKEPRFRQHRHMIVVCSPKERFAKEVWKNVKVVTTTEKLPEGFLSKGMQYVKSPMHLVNTIGYVCRRESRCNFKIGAKKGPLLDKHFYAFETLTGEYLLPLSLQWDGGITDMLYQEKFQNVSVSRLAKSGSLLFQDGRYKQRILDFYGISRGLVLPLHKACAPIVVVGGDNSDEYCHLTNGKKLYLERSADNERMGDEEWLRMQVERGNCFYEAIGEEKWVPRHRDQVYLNFVMPLLNKNGELETENASLKEENEGLEKENASLKRDISNLEDKYQRVLKSKEEQIKSLMGNKTYNMKIGCAKNVNFE